jgi:hypothetical protein
MLESINELKSQKLDSVSNNACRNDQVSIQWHARFSFWVHLACHGMAVWENQPVAPHVRCLLVSGSLNFPVAGMLVK